MTNSKQSPYPFNNFTVTRFETNFWKKYEDVLFSDKETLKTEPAQGPDGKTYTCVFIQSNKGVTKNCIENF
jgi:hypothetical protein